MEDQETLTTKARRCNVQIGDITLTVFHLPDGSYRLSQTEVTGIIHKPARSIFAFLRSKQLKYLLGKGFEFSHTTTNLAGEGSQRPITPIPREMALLYWYR